MKLILCFTVLGRVNQSDASPYLVQLINHETLKRSFKKGNFFKSLGNTEIVLIVQLLLYAKQMIHGWTDQRPQELRPCWMIYTSQFSSNGNVQFQCREERSLYVAKKIIRAWRSGWWMHVSFHFHAGDHSWYAQCTVLLICLRCRHIKKKKKRSMPM